MKADGEKLAECEDQFHKGRSDNLTISQTFRWPCNGVHLDFGNELVRMETIFKLFPFWDEKIAKSTERNFQIGIYLLLAKWYTTIMGCYESTMNEKKYLEWKQFEKFFFFLWIEAKTCVPR